MAKKDLKATELYINRELSWLEFNDRVLQEGLSNKLPLLERLKFLAIVSSNLDEFFLVRVAGLMQQCEAGRQTRDPAGMTPEQQLAAIGARTHRMAAEQVEGIGHVMEQLAEHDLRVLRPSEWSDEQCRFLDRYFAHEILPILTPLAVEDLDPVPLLPSLQLQVAAILASADMDETSPPNQSPNQSPDQAPEEPASLKKTEKAEKTDTSKKEKSKKDDKASKETQTLRKVVVVPVPSQCARFIQLPDGVGTHFARLEDLIAENMVELFPGCPILATAIFRITRDADVAILEDEADDLLEAVEEAVLDRRRRAAVRLEISAKPDPRIKKWLVKWLRLDAPQV